ncbi:uncharacterized protein [Euphorbia lathyris]|uniref:uncharacterized protein n=1 Tax=Euphorbia lathyris TaxID=212925 RepID=UPI00331314DF
MAKKKIHNNHKQNQTPAMTNQQPAMDDPQEKLQNLKSLNDMLLKETIERRQQVESLLQAKENLENQLAQTSAEKNDFKTAFLHESEERLCLEIVRGLFSVFIETQMDETRVIVSSLARENGEKDDEIRCLKGEINGLKVNLEGEREKFSGICQQRDKLMREVDDGKKDSKCLREKLIEMEEKKIQAEEEIKKVTDYYNQSLEQLKEKKEQFDKVKIQRDVAEEKLAVKVKAIEDLDRNLGEILRKKSEIERENGEKKIRIGELEKEVSEYCETVWSLRKEEGNLQCKLMELEKSYEKAIEMAKVMGKENDSLVEEKIEKDRTIGKLMEEMDSRERLVQNLNGELKDKEGLIDTLLREKEEIEDVKVSKEKETVKLHKELVGLGNDVVALQESIQTQEDQNKHLESEVSHYRATLEQVNLEKDNAERDLVKERKNSVSLMSRVLEMEKKVEASVEEFTKMKSQNENLLEEKRGMECEIGSLRKESESVQNTLLQARQEVKDLRKKVESVVSNSARAQTTIKKTVELLSVSENGKEVLSSTERSLHEIEPFATEMEVIKSAFRSKEAAVEEMKHQVELLQNYVSKASKQKGLLAIVSSATTFLFAVSVAYIARLR